MAELIWIGKYKDGKKVAPVRIALPFQAIETINESTQDRLHSLDMFSMGRDTSWKNRLIWGDKKYVLPSLLDEFIGKVNLIYIDPPFNVGANFSFEATIPDNPDTDEDETTSFEKAPNVIEMKAYRDTWGKGLDSYCQWFYETVLMFHELLHEKGMLYVHLDWHVSYYAKAILDEVFGPDNFINEVVWKRQTAKGDVTQGAQHMGRIHESIFIYSKSTEYTWNMQYTPYDQSYMDDFYRHKDADGRRYQLSDITAPGKGKAAKGNPNYEFLGITRYWRFSKENMNDLYKQGKIVQTAPGTVPRQKRYLDEMPGVPLQDIWLDIQHVQAQSAEGLGYDTQKPEALLDRIIKVSSNEGDLVFDCFAGSGTTAAVAEKLKRRWITCDLSRYSIHTARKRLLSIPGISPFVIQNLGKYERQAWQNAEFPEPHKQAEKELRYGKFILDLYKANPVAGYSWLHGMKNGRMVHVGNVDAPVTLADVKAIAAETKKSIGKGKDAPRKAAVDALGWDFALEVNEVARQVAAEADVDVVFKVIPREVLDKKAVDQGDIKFFELASLTVDQNINGLEVFLKLKDFIIPPQDVPAEVQKAIKHWSQWVDYWAVDWDYKNDTFHNQWQSYRSKSDPDLELKTSFTYKQSGEYQVVVKVIDILGNDTTKLHKIKVTDAPKKKK